MKDGHYSKLQVLQSAAGFYVGKLFKYMNGEETPGSRDSEYFQTEAEAQEALAEMQGFRQLCTGVNESQITKMIAELLKDEPQFIHDESAIVRQIMVTSRGRWNPSVITQIVKDYVEAIKFKKL